MSETSSARTPEQWTDNEAANAYVRACGDSDLIDDDVAVGRVLLTLEAQVADWKSVVDQLEARTEVAEKGYKEVEQSLRDARAERDEARAVHQSYVADYGGNVSLNLELERARTRIAELEAQYETSHASRIHAEKVLDRTEARIAELEAALRDLLDAYDRNGWVSGASGNARATLERSDPAESPPATPSIGPAALKEGA